MFPSKETEETPTFAPLHFCGWMSLLILHTRQRQGGTVWYGTPRARADCQVRRALGVGMCSGEDGRGHTWPSFQTSNHFTIQAMFINYSLQSLCDFEQFVWLSSHRIAVFRAPWLKHTDN